MAKSSVALYPGSFDPVTNGHIDLIRRATALFDRVVVACAQSLDKTPLFSLEERLAMVQEVTVDIPGVEVTSFDGLVVDYAQSLGTAIVIRGMRMISDFEYEFQMALTNRKLCEDVETIFMMPSEQYSYLSSRLIKEAASMGADVSAFVPASVATRLHERLAKQR